MHPAKEGFSALPFFDEFDLSTVDVLLISQYVNLPKVAQILDMVEWATRCTSRGDLRLYLWSLGPYCSRLVFEEPDTFECHAPLDSIAAHTQTSIVVYLGLLNILLIC